MTQKKPKPYPRAKREVSPAVERVTVYDTDILAYTTAENEVAELEEQLAIAKARASEKKAALFEKLRRPHAFGGKLSARIEVREEQGKFSPPYKQLYVNHMCSEHGWTPKGVDDELRAAVKPATKEVEELVIVYPEGASRG